MVARVLLDPGQPAWIEEPGYLGARNALLGAGAKLIPVPVDAEGLNVDAGIRRARKARLAYISPSHQYPLGVTMTLARRLQMLAWAGRSDAWILEDDYDSEFRHSSRPIAALQGLDKDARVIYLGTLSKVLFPSLRLAYLVVPVSLIAAMTSAMATADYCAPLVNQAVLADFIAEGHFARHIRRMRQLYKHRQAVLVGAVQKELRGLLELKPSDCGMHAVAWLPRGVDDKRVARNLGELGVGAPAVSSYCLERCPRGGLVLGFGNLAPEEIPGAVRLLKKGLRASFRQRG
jgi:GntR family transcriptional regulator/MocR family aminotransferase